MPSRLVADNNRAAPSGGTVASFLNLFDSYSISKIQRASRPYISCPIPHNAPQRPPTTLSGVYYDPVLGTMSTSITAGVDASVVERTWGLLHSSLPGREDEFYGENFTWQELGRTNGWIQGVSKNWAVMIGSAFLALLPPLRAVLRRALVQPGLGPSRESIKEERVEFQGVAKADGEQFNGKKAFVRAAWQGGMYDREYRLVFLVTGGSADQPHSDGCVPCPGSAYAPAGR